MNENTMIKATPGHRLIRRSTTKKVHIFKDDQRLCKVPYKGSPVIPVETCRLNELCGNCRRHRHAFDPVQYHGGFATPEERDRLEARIKELEEQLDEHEEQILRCERIKELIPQTQADNTSFIHEKMISMEEGEFAKWYTKFVGEQRLKVVKELTGFTVEEVKELDRGYDRLITEQGNHIKTLMKLKNLTEENSDLSPTANAAIDAIKEMDKAQYHEYRYVVGTEDQLDNRKWWNREPIIHETMLNRAGPFEAIEYMEKMKRYGRSQAFLLVPVNIKAIMEDE